ncbi:CelD/BcsL family acetyltransferase involved in cellulose biosynthesis [Microvirga flocculans]|uniref:CelD/BcsL family acetyltransferase involved in cellulose biosynthesis n=1 Tax=Microvirga flocculans TaxID=217168 RepID=A0A7W6IFY9_9HYPH|nr:GNAT family N-acetyltransferase [Microvirga flocculans]MBB4040792.1 CelD/BcsL family acetyltransferase involved in cellulose biosynthesis [Microvirga flocculans]
MEISVVSATNLSQEQVLSWARIQQHNPGLFSPFFRPEFTQAVASIRDDVYVAVVDDGAVFFPYQRNFFGMGRPVGGAVSDYHGLIAAPDYRLDPATLLRACGLTSWRFDHVPAEQTMFSSWQMIETGSPVVDLTPGDLPGSTALHADHRRKRRRLERDFGPVDVDLDMTDQSMLELCMTWKSAQYRRMKQPDLFAKPWARALLKEIATHHTVEFSGILSVLRAGGRPIAAHFGMRSGNVWHYWFPTYDPDFHRYSPGILLLLEMMAQAPKFGISTIDFGRGDNDYKMRISNRTVPLQEGIVVTNRLSSQMLGLKRNLFSFVKKHPTIKNVLNPAHQLLQDAYRRARLRMYWFVPLMFVQLVSELTRVCA